VLIIIKTRVEGHWANNEFEGGRPHDWVKWGGSVEMSHIIY